MAIKKTKITEEELKELENFQQTINTITFQLGQLSLRKLNLESEENNLKNQYSSLLQTEKELGDRLKEKYGDSQIDLKTGELIQSE
jgi:predicted transcriptional regulator|tara:strand:- start:2573 stop:2830 length:258 start_codon:yes stop_codon:yes gene_type:complete